MLNYYRKFEDLKFNTFVDMTLQCRVIFLGTPGICVFGNQILGEKSKGVKHLKSMIYHHI